MHRTRLTQRLRGWSALASLGFVVANCSPDKTDLFGPGEMGAGRGGSAPGAGGAFSAAAAGVPGGGDALSSGTGGRGLPPCTIGVRCGSVECVDLQTNANHCGECGKACAPRAVCDAAVCLCPGTEQLCGNTCVDTETSEEHCGKCGTPCEGGTCTDGACVCPEGTENCGNRCVDLLSTYEHCGKCDATCINNQVCQEGECGCASGQTDCDGVCADLTSDAEHCGDCAIACSNNQICEAEECVCPPNLMDCDGFCADLKTDAKNCGGCGDACPSNQVCADAQCGCRAGEVICSQETCSNLASDAKNCGECGDACPAGNACVDSTCRSPCYQICDNPKPVPQDGNGFRVEPLGTGAGCYEVLGYAPASTEARIVCWEFQGGREIRVNGQTVPCISDSGHPLTESPVGGYCVQVAAGDAAFAGFLFPTR